MRKKKQFLYVESSSVMTFDEHTVDGWISFSLMDCTRRGRVRGAKESIRDHIFIQISEWGCWFYRRSTAPKKSLQSCYCCFIVLIIKIYHHSDNEVLNGEVTKQQTARLKRFNRTFLSPAGVRENSSHCG